MKTGENAARAPRRHRLQRCSIDGVSRTRFKPPELGAQPLEDLDRSGSSALATLPPGTARTRLTGASIRFDPGCVAVVFVPAGAIRCHPICRATGNKRSPLSGATPNAAAQRPFAPELAQFRRIVAAHRQVGGVLTCVADAGHAFHAEGLVGRAAVGGLQG